MDRHLSHCTLLIAGVLLAAGCGSENPTEPTPAKPSLTTFSTLKSTLFTPTCATSGCHGETAPNASLQLTPDQAYANLVDVTSVQSPSLKRVKPFDSANSYLMKKLNGSGTSVMPPGGKLNKARIDSVAAWITRGAPND